MARRNSTTTATGNKSAHEKRLISSWFLDFYRNIVVNSARDKLNLNLRGDREWPASVLPTNSNMKLIVPMAEMLMALMMGKISQLVDGSTIRWRVAQDALANTTASGSIRRDVICGIKVDTLEIFTNVASTGTFAGPQYLGTNGEVLYGSTDLSTAFAPLAYAVFDYKKTGDANAKEVLEAVGKLISKLDDLRRLPLDSLPQSVAGARTPNAQDVVDLEGIFEEAITTIYVYLAYKMKPNPRAGKTTAWILKYRDDADVTGWRPGMVDPSAIFTNAQNFARFIQDRQVPGVTTSATATTSPAPSPSSAPAGAGSGTGSSTGAASTRRRSRTSSPAATAAPAPPATGGAPRGAASAGAGIPSPIIPTSTAVSFTELMQIGARVVLDGQGTSIVAARGPRGSGKSHSYTMLTDGLPTFVFEFDPEEVQEQICEVLPGSSGGVVTTLGQLGELVRASQLRGLTVALQEGARFPVRRLLRRYGRNKLTELLSKLAGDPFDLNRQNDLDEYANPIFRDRWEAVNYVYFDMDVPSYGPVMRCAIDEFYNFAKFKKANTMMKRFLAGQRWLKLGVAGSAMVSGGSLAVALSGNASASNTFDPAVMSRIIAVIDQEWPNEDEEKARMRDANRRASETLAKKQQRKERMADQIMPSTRLVDQKFKPTLAPCVIVPDAVINALYEFNEHTRNFYKSGTFIDANGPRDGIGYTVMIGYLMGAGMSARNAFELTLKSSIAKILKLEPRYGVSDETSKQSLERKIIASATSAGL